MAQGYKVSVDGSSARYHVKMTTDLHITGNAKGKSVSKHIELEGFTKSDIEKHSEHIEKQAWPQSCRAAANNAIQFLENNTKNLGVVEVKLYRGDSIRLGDEEGVVQTKFSTARGKGA
jgi:hypothetical protein